MFVVPLHSPPPPTSQFRVHLNTEDQDSSFPGLRPWCQSDTRSLQRTPVSHRGSREREEVSQVTRGLRRGRDAGSQAACLPARQPFVNSRKEILNLPARLLLRSLLTPWASSSLLTCSSWCRRPAVLVNLRILFYFWVSPLTRCLFKKKKVAYISVIYGPTPAAS